MAAGPRMELVGKRFVCVGDSGCELDVSRIHEWEWRSGVIRAVSYKEPSNSELSDDPSSYHNRKGLHSVVLQVVVDHNCCFTDVYVGWPGRTHDARVLLNSPIYSIAEDAGGYLFPREVSRNVNGVEIPARSVGDPAYPLKRWLMKGFTQHHILDH